MHVESGDAVAAGRQTGSSHWLFPSERCSFLWLASARLGEAIDEADSKGPQCVELRDQLLAAYQLLSKGAFGFGCKIKSLKSGYYFVPSDGTP